MKLALGFILAGALLAACTDARPGESVADDTAALATPRYLIAAGVGDEASANAYYASIIPGFSPRTYRLTDWVREFMPQSSTLAVGFYRNANDLGFWREMYCTDAIRRGDGGCFVTNYRNEGDRQAGVANVGTVAMNVSPEGFARFYAFGPDGVLTPSVALDSEGAKFVPQVCVTCHAGQSAETGDQGSIFREFETSLLQAPTGILAPTSERQWRTLNFAILSANDAIRTETEGAPRGTAFAKTRIADHVNQELYGADPLRSVPLDQQSLPRSWASPDDSADLLAAKEAVWRTTVAPSCMPCHRTNQSLDFSDYGLFSRLARRSGGGPSFLESVMAPDAVRLMPQAELSAKNLAAKSAAKQGFSHWLDLANPQ